MRIILLMSLGSNLRNTSPGTIHLQIHYFLNWKQLISPSNANPGNGTLHLKQREHATFRMLPVISLFSQIKLNYISVHYIKRINEMTLVDNGYIRLYFNCYFISHKGTGKDTRWLVTSECPTKPFSVFAVYCHFFISLYKLCYHCYHL